MTDLIKRVRVQTDTFNIHAENADTLGLVDVGSSVNPIYLDEGVATPSDETVGSTATPVYLDSGTIKPATSVQATKLGSATVGSGTNPIYISSGTATKSSSTVGSATKPVYLNSGVFTAASGTVNRKVSLYSSDSGMSSSSSAKTVSGLDEYCHFLARIQDNDYTSRYLVAPLYRITTGASKIKGTALDVGENTGTVNAYFVELLASGTSLTVNGITRATFKSGSTVTTTVSTKYRLIALYGIW